MDVEQDPSLELKQPTGLSSAEARVRLEQEGYNELPSTRQRSTFAIAVEVAREPMFLLLIVSVAIYLGLGDLREALVLSLSLFVIFGITDFSGKKNRARLGGFARSFEPARPCHSRWRAAADRGT